MFSNLPDHRYHLNARWNCSFLLTYPLQTWELESLWVRPWKSVLVFFFLKASQVSLIIHYIWERAVCCLWLCLRNLFLLCICDADCGWRWSEGACYLEKSTGLIQGEGVRQAQDYYGKFWKWSWDAKIIHFPIASINEDLWWSLSGPGLCYSVPGSEIMSHIHSMNQRAVKSCSWNGLRISELIDCSSYPRISQ